jgi:hypothetical protein
MHRSAQVCATTGTPSHSPSSANQFQSVQCYIVDVFIALRLRCCPGFFMHECCKQRIDEPCTQGHPPQLVMPGGPAAPDQPAPLPHIQHRRMTCFRPCMFMRLAHVWFPMVSFVFCGCWCPSLEPLVVQMMLRSVQLLAHACCKRALVSLYPCEGSSCGEDGFVRPSDQRCSIPSATARHTSVCSVVHSRCGYLSCVKHFLDVPVTGLNLIA